MNELFGTGSFIDERKLIASRTATAELDTFVMLVDVQRFNAYLSSTELQPVEMLPEQVRCILGLRCSVEDLHMNYWHCF